MMSHLVSGDQCSIGIVIHHPSVPSNVFHRFCECSDSEHLHSSPSWPGLWGTFLLLGCFLCAPNSLLRLR